MNLFFNWKNKKIHIPLNTTAAVAPIAPKKAEYAGHFSVTPEGMVMKVKIIPRDLT